MLPGMQTIDAATLHARLDRGDPIVLLDVRRPETLAGGRLPGSRHCISDDVLERAGEVVPERDATVVTYCRAVDCRRSMRAAERLESLGYADVVRFTGGIAEWEAAGYELAR